MVERTNESSYWLASQVISLRSLASTVVATWLNDSMGDNDSMGYNGMEQPAKGRNAMTTIRTKYLRCDSRTIYRIPVRPLTLSPYGRSRWVLSGAPRLAEADAVGHVDLPSKYFEICRLSDG